jgi:hypothetical protein
MIPVKRVEEPAEFDAKARTPGLAWLKKNPGAKRPADYWSRFKPQLADGFNNLCGYSAMLEPVGTVDHFLSCKNHPERAYDWSNYRFAQGWINSSKQKVDDAVLDPYEVGEGWFEIILPSLQMKVTDSVPERLRSRAEFTLIRLGLRDDERIIRQRRIYYKRYTDGKLPLEELRIFAPLIAAAVDKQLAEQAAK